MTPPRVLILRAPGTNCDRETAFAFEQAGGQADVLHVNRVLESPARFRDYQILCIPGGFSFGDDLGAGRIFGNLMQHHLAEEMRQFLADGKLVLGICNGFQVLLKTRILVGADPVRGPEATLTLNDSGRYEDRWVRLAAASDRCVFLRGVESLYLPVAHAEGKFVCRDAAVYEQLEAAGQLVLRYRPQAGNGCATTSRAAMATAAQAAAGTAAAVRAEAAIAFPDNPNGSMGNVAGLSDPTGRALGLMPHPERHIDPTQHPRWTRGEAGAVGDGLQLFINAVQYFA